MKSLMKTALLLISVAAVGSLSGNTGQQRMLKFFHTHTGESLRVIYFNQGEYDPEAFEDIRVFLADWRDQTQHDINPQLMDVLWQLQQTTGSTDTWEVISAYRSPETNELLRNDDLSIRAVDILTRSILLEAYEDHDFAPYWTNPDRVMELMELINNSADHGLIPSDYNIDQVNRILQRRMASPAAEIEVETDILLTESVLRYGYHRRFGKVKASSLDPDINFRRENFHQQSSSITLEQGLGSSSLTDFIQIVAATGPIYKKLQARMKYYRDIASKGGWPTVPDGPTLRADGKIRFYKDIYNRDQKVLDALDGPVVIQPPSPG